MRYVKEKKVTVSIIIPNWNGCELLKVCLASLRKQVYKDFEVKIVDNGSTDDSVKFVNQNYPEFDVISLDKNYGFAKAVNVGINKSGGEYLFLLNNDTEIEKDCIGKLAEVLETKKQIGFVTGKVLQFNNRRLIDSVGDYIDIVGHADHIGRGEADGEGFSSPGEVFLATAGAMLVRRRLIEKVGLFDEDFFMYMEDIDLCLRAQFQGYKGFYEPKAVIYHIHKATSLKNPSKLEYLQFRNMMQIIIKDFPSFLIWRNFNWLKIILVNLNTLRYLTTKGFFWQAIGAQAFIIGNLFGLIAKRNQIQSNILVDREYIIDNFRDKKLKIPFVNSRI